MPVDKVRIFPSAPPNSNSGSWAGFGVYDNQLYFNSGNGAQRVGDTINPYGEHWYVSQFGSDSNDGKSWANAFLTWTKVFEKIEKGDVIHLYGEVPSVAGGHTTPQGVTDITVIGHGSHRIRHGHTTLTTGPKVGSAEWSANASATAANLTVTQQGWSFYNINFDGHASYPIIKLVRNADGDSVATGYNGSHILFSNCTFVGPSTFGIQQSGGCINVGIYGCHFYGFNTTGNKAVGVSTQADGASIGLPINWEIIGNRFQCNETDIYLRSLVSSQILGNHFLWKSHILNAATPTTNSVAIDVTGSLDVLIAGNYMYCDSAEAGVVNSRFVPGTRTTWSRNFYSDKEEYAEPAE